jgi:lysophospholipid acyltransferase (LPLAT)-like uncharacterized protein
MNEWGFRATGVLGQGLLGGLFLTTRSKRVGEDHFGRFRREGRPVVFVFWHGQLLPLVHYHRDEDVVVLVSEHGDGEYITRVIERHGFRTVRGSSTRGGIRGLKALIRAANAGHDLALTPDGPKGPMGEFKPGALMAAQVTGAPVIPVAVGASSAWYVKSWDRFMVPRPLSRVVIEYGEPVHVPRGAAPTDREAIARTLATTLDRMTARSSAAAEADA